jgi:8-oxo-dGTP pyrophosphatase MutT (NUDIX family)
MADPHDREPAHPEPWPRRAHEHGEHMLLFRPRYDQMENPRTGEVLRRLVLETPDWVNVVALTRVRRLVVVRQYRFGTSQLTLEIPGGVIDRGETHADAAARELREETGFTSSRWTYLGAVEPNPAFQTNLCHHWLAEECERTHELELDGGEDIALGTLSLDEARAMIQSGAIRHALVITALARVLDLSREDARRG